MPNLDRASRSTVAVTLGLACLLPVYAVAAAPPQLATPSLQKAAVKCQTALAQIGARVLTGKFKALDACANAALACVQTKQAQADVCFGKAAATCAKKLDAEVAAVVKAQRKIESLKSCASDLRLVDLLADDGLGLGEIAETCQTDFDLDICGGLAPLAHCLLRTHERAAGFLYGQARPRTGELLTLLPDVLLPPIDGLPTVAGCQSCSTVPSAQKGVEQCGRALTKATQGLVARLTGQLETCAEQVFTCAQSKAGKPECPVKAAAKCDKAATTLAKAFAKFGAALAKSCGDAAVDFARLAAPSGLNLDALAASCSALGTGIPTNVGGLTACLTQRATCTIATLARQAIARTPEFAAGGGLGALRDELAATCPAPVNAVARAAQTGGRAPFGSIFKFLKGIRLLSNGRVGTIVNGPAPGSSPGSGRGPIVGRAARVIFGGITKFPFTYHVGGTRSGTSAGRTAGDPPALMVAVQRQDLAVSDHFEVPLSLPAGSGEMDVPDELEIAYQDTLPSCVFTLTLATRIDGKVSAYTPLVQVVDASLTPGPTPTATATPKPCDGMTCTPSDQCHVAGTCDPDSGICSNPPAAGGTTCSDGNPSTYLDACNNGTCAGIACPCEGDIFPGPTGDPTWGSSFATQGCSSSSSSTGEILALPMLCFGHPTGQYLGHLYVSFVAIDPPGNYECGARTTQGFPSDFDCSFTPASTTLSPLEAEACLLSLKAIAAADGVQCPF